MIAATDELELTLREAGLDVRPIPRAGAATPEALRRAVADRSGPMLFSELAEDWTARTTWTPANLARMHGATSVRALIDLPADGVLFPQDQQHYERTLPFSEFIDRMLSASAEAPCYLAYTRAEEIFSPRDYDFSALLGRPGAGADTRVWIGSAGTRSMLHSDLKDNLFCQIWGIKHVVLLPWEQSSAAYPFPDNLVNSSIDLAALDLDAFPKLRSAVLYAGAIGPGEILYMPRGTWHDVRSRTPSISINHWFGSPLAFPDYAALLARLGPRYWAATARDFVLHGLLGQRVGTRFFYSPPSTGKRLYDLLRWGDFSRDNDPVANG